jgi:uncharacterized membrane protein
LVGTLSGSQTAHLSELEEQQDYQRAAGAYLVWPLAAVALVREAPDASRWTRIHARQALMFGLLASFGYVVVLALPLLSELISGFAISPETTVWIYAAGMLLDLVVFIVLTVLAFSYAARAGRGELFTIPLVSGIADRVFTIRR